MSRFAEAFAAAQGIGALGNEPVGKTPVLLDQAGNEIPQFEPAPPRDERLQPNPELAAALRNLADAAEQGYIVALAGAGIVLNPDPDQPPSVPTFIHDHPLHRVQMIGSLSQLQHLLNQTEANVRMASLARAMG